MNEPLPCGVCGLLLQDERHESAGDCIRGLRSALIKQKRLAEEMAFDISTRYLAAIEELSLRPEVGIPYYTRVPDQPENIVQVSHQQVAGVFTAIVRKYRALGDWSPLQAIKKEVESARELYSMAIGVLEMVMTPDVVVSCDRSVLEALQKLGERSMQLGAPLRDLPGFESHRR